MSALEMNHAMIYSRDVARALGFYRDLLGFTLLEEYRAGDRAVYARLKPPAGAARATMSGVPREIFRRAVRRRSQQHGRKALEPFRPPSTG